MTRPRCPAPCRAHAQSGHRYQRQRARNTRFRAALSKAAPGCRPFWRTLKREKRFAKATHNSWAVILTGDGVAQPLKGDDGEAGAGNIILRMADSRRGLQRPSCRRHALVWRQAAGRRPISPCAGSRTALPHDPSLNRTTRVNLGLKNRGKARCGHFMAGQYRSVF